MSLDPVNLMIILQVLAFSGFYFGMILYLKLLESCRCSCRRRIRVFRSRRRCCSTSTRPPTSDIGPGDPIGYWGIWKNQKFGWRLKFIYWDIFLQMHNFLMIVSKVQVWIKMKNGWTEVSESWHWYKCLKNWHLH